MKITPREHETHYLCLACSGRHLHDIPRPILRKHIRRHRPDTIVFDERILITGIRHLVEINDSLHRFTLGEIVPKLVATPLTIEEYMLRRKPKTQEWTRSLAHSRVPATTPLRDLYAYPLDERRQEAKMTIPKEALLSRKPTNSRVKYLIGRLGEMGGKGHKMAFLNAKTSTNRFLYGIFYNRHSYLKFTFWYLSSHSIGKYCFFFTWHTTYFFRSFTRIFSIIFF